MTNFKVFYNNWDGTASISVFKGVDEKTSLTMPKDVFGNMEWEKVVPADMWADWKRGMSIEGWRIEDSLMWKAIQPNTPAKGRKPHNFNFIIKGEGVAPNYLAKVQEPGPFANRTKTKEEQLFKDWFIHLCKCKFEKTPKY
jgi:hypothetical protein